MDAVRRVAAVLLAVCLVAYLGWLAVGVWAHGWGYLLPVLAGWAIGTALYAAGRWAVVRWRSR